ncbi:NAD-P-binding protein [Rhizoctonia solani]|nr:NAD-P-binding protein [Rhizoctonia solani]
MSKPSPSSPVVLLTGCSFGGIGYALCEAFASRGCIVYATSRRLESMSTLTHPSIRCLEMDVTSDNSVNKCVEKVIEEAGRLDFAIANAGIPCYGPVLDVRIEDARRALDTNVLGVLRLAQAVFPHMAIRKRGTFVTIGSVAGCTLAPWAGLYSASKAAAHSLTETLQMEAQALSPNIHVMLVIAAEVRSRFASNSTFQVPENSLFKSYAPGITACIEFGKDGSMSTSKFANGVVNIALRKQGPPRTFSYGAYTLFFRVLRCLPKWIVHWFTWKLLARTTV